MNRFLDLADFTRDQVADLLDLAQRLQTHPEPQALAGRILGLLFLNPSLRTLSSFQAGMMRLGGSAFVATAGQGTWQVETRVGAVMNAGAAEHVREAIPVLASYCDALGIRSFAEGKDLAADLADGQFRMYKTIPIPGKTHLNRAGSYFLYPAFDHKKAAACAEVDKLVGKIIKDKF